ncbi:MAG: DUF3581 domain-containing protein [Gammaproteobacteria bacterium]|nr:DUF3581 domain-containing protein [Gammaproteobacteria bacterium]
MNIENYYQLDGNKLSFNREQASEFAKTVAGDFNQLHNIDAKRFCVPGDLLFAVIIQHYGLRQTMGFSFSGMVDEDVTLVLPQTKAREISIYDLNDKKFLDVSSNGEISRNPELIKSLTQRCVEFSGHSFPHVLVPLMKEHNTMINTDRPLVIYDHMRISLETLEMESVSLEHASSEFRIYGKRGEVALNFNLFSNGEQTGKGQKKMVLSGLREYDQSKIDELVDSIEKSRDEYSKPGKTG